MNFIRSIRFFMVGLAIGALIQLPLMIGMKAWTTVAVQAIIFIVATPLAVIGFLKK